jgi:hypothetical protein
MRLANGKLTTTDGPFAESKEARVDGMIDRLIEAGMLDPERTDRSLLRLQVLTQVFFWVPAALVGAPDRDPAEQLDLHARAALALFLVYATAAGRRQLSQILGPSRTRRAPRR